MQNFSYTTIVLTKIIVNKIILIFCIKRLLKTSGRRNQRVLRNYPENPVVIKTIDIIIFLKNLLLKKLNYFF